LFRIEISDFGFRNAQQVKFAFKILYRIYRVISTLRYRAVRRLTRAGLFLLGALLLAGVMGPDTDDSVSYQGFTLLLCVLVGSVAFSCFFRGRFSATRLLPRFGTVGCPLNYSINVRNLTAKAQAGLTLLEDLADPRPAFADWLAVQLAEEKQARSFRMTQRRRTHLFKPAVLKESPVPPAPPGEEVRVRVELTPLQRGVLRFNGVTLARPDPLGLCRAFARVPEPQSLLVLPRRYALPPMDLPGALRYQPGGVALASRVGQSEDFVAVRDYRHGDPWRHIHWRSWARAGKPVVKEFEDEFFVRHALVLDTFSEHPKAEVFEEAVSVAASFACTLQTQESLLDLLFVGPQSYCFTGGRGLAHADQMLEILASVRVCYEQPFRALEHLVLNHLSVVSGCICVLLAWDEARHSLVEKLRSAGVPVLVLMVVEPGQGKGLDLGPMQDEPHRFRVLEVGRIEQGLGALT
jgi:uncharacterized protein (DUF58 family)